MLTVETDRPKDVLLIPRSLSSQSWLPREAPPHFELQRVFDELTLSGCVRQTSNGEQLLTEHGKQILDLPTQCEYAALILAAQRTSLLDAVLAGIAFLEAAGGGSIETPNLKALSKEYMVCGMRADGVQDDFLRFSHFTMLSCDHYRKLKLLADNLNVLIAALKRAADIY